MREVTKYLLDSLQPIFNNKEKKTNAIHLQTFVTPIFSLLEEGEILFDKTPSILSSPVHWVTNETMAKGKNYHFIQPSIREEKIEKNDKVETTYRFSLKGHDISLTFVFPFHEDDKKPDSLQSMQSYFDECTHSLFLCLSVVLSYASPDCSKELDFYIYMTDAVKLLPKNKNEVLDMVHVNTGATQSCLKNNSIYVYRQEEWLKVSVHESFHALGLDFSQLTMDETTNGLFESRIKEIFPRLDDSISLLIYETYTEWMAEIIQLCLYCYKNRGEKPLVPFFMKHLEKERLFSCFQFAKIMVHQGISWSEMVKKDSCLDVDCKDKVVEISLYKENTNVFAYYILKTILLYHYEDMARWILEENGGSIQFDMKQCEKHAESFCKIIKDNSASPDFLKTIAFMEKKIHAMKKETTLERRTMRMTLFE